MHIIIEIKESCVKGKLVEYLVPVCARAKLLCDLIGRDEFQEKHLRIIRRLGYHIAIKDKPKPDFNTLPMIRTVKKHG